MEDNTKITRIVLIDEEKKLCEYSNYHIKFDLQDQGRTLKLFLRKKK